MIVLNDKKFAKNDKEFTDSLFHREGTCVGFYKVTSKNIFLLNIQKERIGFIPRDKDLLGAAKKVDKNKYSYSYATIKEVGDFPSYRSEIENIREVKNQFGTSHTR